MKLLRAMRTTGHDKLVFSSTCAVYGLPQALPLQEQHPKNPISPYGRAKLAVEWMLEDHFHAHGIRLAALRYFNAAGCEAEDGLGEDHRPETHLIPNVVRYALDQKSHLDLFGDDYPTPDGTCIRDYIYVTDLAEAHLRAWEELEVVPALQLNLGTGRGISNLEIMDAAGRLSGKKVEPEIAERRSGDPPQL